MSCYYNTYVSIFFLSILLYIFQKRYRRSPMTQFGETLTHKHAKNVSPNDRNFARTRYILYRYTFNYIYIWDYVCVCDQWTGTRACKRLDDRSLDKIACSIVFNIYFIIMYIIIGLSVKILGFPGGDSRTHVSEAVVFATLNVVKYDVFPCARGMMYIKYNNII